ncbi:MAG: GntR family transcriptional regulator [Lactobacillales bacterium]|jgi:DNA-binding GntR family transcriptional regulator|nr:GntR family transcriptional regulator [Lactobacillales bacterium]
MVQRTKVLYIEIANSIRSDILSGRYPVGELLPTEIEFEELFSVSKITVRKAIDLLVNENYVSRKSGKGTMVLNNRPYNKLSKATTFTEELAKSGRKVERVNHELKAMNLKPTHEAYPFLGESVIHLSRTYLLDGKPYIYYEYYLPASVRDMTPQELDEQSLYQLMLRRGIEIEKFHDFFTVKELTEKEQDILKTSTTHALCRTRQSFSEKKVGVEYSKAIYNTAMAPYMIEFEV